MLDCVITGISQDMDFEQGLTLTYLVVRLPNGALLKAAVDDGAATEVLALQAELKGLPRPAIRTAPTPSPQQGKSAQAAPAAEPQGEDPVTYEEEEEPQAASAFTPAAGESVYVFGGQDDTPEEKAAMAEGSPTLVVEEPVPQAPVAAPARSSLQRTPSGKLIAPSRTVPARIGGYPDTKNGVDTDELTTMRDRDEDGVGSV